MGAAPDRCVVIGDSPPSIEAALATGMQVIAYTPHGEVTRNIQAIRSMS